MAAPRLGETRHYGAQAPDIEERLALLVEASRVLADVSLEPPAVMERLCGLVVPWLGSACVLRLMMEDRRWLRTVASALAVPELRPLFQALTAPLVRADEGVAGEVLRSGEALGVSDVTGEDLRRVLPGAYPGALDRFPFRHLLVLPLRARGHSMGTLTVWREERARPFEAGERLLLQELADRAAMALDVARAYAAERQARQAAEVAAGRLARLQHVTAELSEVLTAARVAEVVIDHGLEAVGARGGGLWLVEPGEPHAQRVRSAGDLPELDALSGTVPLSARTPMGACIRELQPVWLETPDALATRFPEVDARRARLTAQPAPAWVCLPLVVDGRALGALLFAFGAPHPFDADERAFLQLVAHHAAQALARARLLEQEQRARAALREAHQTLAAIIQASPAGIMLLDPDGTVRLWNPAAERMFGWTADEVLGQVLPAVPESRREEFHQSLERVTTQGLVLTGAETERLRRDGSTVQVAQWTSLVRPASGPPQCLGMVVDITERQRGEEAQRFLAEAGGVLAGSLEQEETLDRVARLAVPAYAESCGVFLAEDGGTVRCVATAHAPDAAGHVPAEDVPAPGLPGVSRVITSGEPELRTDDAGGVPATRRSCLCVPLWVRGQTIGALSFVTSRRAYDARDLALAQELARRAALAIDNARLYREARHAIRLREEFLSIASHELKTPITSLQLQVQRLQAGLGGTGTLPPPERLRRTLELVERQVRRQTQLVNDLLDVSRISAGRLELRPESLDLAALVREVAERFEPELARTGTRVDLALAPEATGQWDRLRLDQVLTNLLSNAVKYGRGNPVRVEVEVHEEHVRLAVHDGGIGIASEHLPRLFHRFERAVSERNYGGFGLGLWIARQIVEAMGGLIFVRSELGVGSTFSVELPRG